MDINNLVGVLELIRDEADRLIDEVVRSAEELSEHPSGRAAPNG